MDLHLQEKVAIVTGGSHGLGKSICLGLAAEGAKVVVNYRRSPERAEAVVNEIQERYPKQIEAGNLVVVPDAASRQRSTTNAAESDLSLLKKGGFVVKSQSSNPQVADRINCVNVLLLANRLKVSNKCNYLIKSMEQQSYSRTGAPEKGIGGVDDVSGPVDALGYGITYLSPLRRWASGGSFPSRRRRGT